MKKWIVVFGIVLLFGTSQAQNADSSWVANHYTKMERMIPMRDGIRLFTSIYIPRDKKETHPILMRRTPYSCAPYGETFSHFWGTFQMDYLKEGYILVFQDVRGRWMSEGDFVDIRPFNGQKKTNKDIDEASDTYDTVDWLLKNIEHNNGRVGVSGISYPGFYATMAAASNHPAIRAVSPQAPVTNWFAGDDFHHNGAFFLLDAFSFYSPIGWGFGIKRKGPTTVPPQSVGFPIYDNYNYFLETGPLANFLKLTGDSVPFWKELYDHPDYDAWWKARDARNATVNLKPAMLWVGGNFDAEDNWGAWNAYLAAERNNPKEHPNRLVMGPWYHGQWGNNDGTHLGRVTFGSNTSKWYQQEIELPFFNYYLKQKGSLADLAEATIFVSGANEWKKFDQWPPAGVQNRSIYLQPNGGLAWKAPGGKDQFEEYVSDPAHPVPYASEVHLHRTRTYMVDDQRFAERRPDVVTFKTEVLQEDVLVTGAVKAQLYSAISTTDADFVVKLIDVFPDGRQTSDVDIYSDGDPKFRYPMGGYEMLVHGEILRGKYRHSLEKPEPFVPEKIEEVAFTVANVAHQFKKGHRIMVQIQSSWFPLVDRNPQKFVNIYQASEADFQKSTIRIYHDAQHPSRIELPTL